MASARQIAAAKRNIAKAQLASARARKGKKRSSSSMHTYGTGRSGRRATKRALYGSRRHGISPTQYQRRRQRANKWKARAVYTGTAISFAAGLWGGMNQTQREYAKYAAKSGLNNLKTKYKYQTGVGRQIRKARKK